MGIPVIIIGLLGLVLVLCLFALARNEWVYSQRTALNDECYLVRRRAMGRGEVLPNDWWDDYYLSYDAMMRRFWVWDVNRLQLPGKRNPYRVDGAA